LNEILGRENFRNELVINRTLAKQRVDSQFVVQTESLFLYSKSDRFVTKPVERPTPPQWYPLLHFPRKDERPRTILGETFYPPKNRRWALSQERIDQLQRRGKLRINQEAFYIDFRGKKSPGMPEVLYDSEAVGNDWLDIPGYAQRHHFPTENAEALLQRVIESTSQPGELVMDFFLGSGTTVAVAHKMQRQWIGIELGEHFHTVILPRMKTVLFGDTSGISKSANWDGGGFFKYQQLEQFEDTLENIQFQPSSPVLEKLDDYFIRYKIPHETQNSAPFLNLPLFRDPFHYRMNVVHDYEYQAQEVDLVETFNYLLGVHVKRLEVKEEQNRRYVWIAGEVNQESVLIIWRSIEDLDFQKDKAFIEKNMAGYACDKMYANGDCAVAGFKNIELEMRERLLSNTDKD
jgi:adenine-specific DNA-methyltransferase